MLKRDMTGVVYSSPKTTFRVFAPSADVLELNLFADAISPAYYSVQMSKKDDGIWEQTVDGNLDGVFYTFTVRRAESVAEAVDIYAKAVSVNGSRGAVVNLKDTNPDGWEQTGYVKLSSPVDAVIYETHIRDFTSDADSGVKKEYRGKFLGLAERGTVNSDNLSTGIDHLLEMGITHVHLLPFFDYTFTDESAPVGQYNWGYDPLNYNVPEGSYATNPYDIKCRIRECKQMIMALHNAGIGVIMDVVYNHTALSENSNFNVLEPQYYRRTADGGFSNGSGCGNETDSCFLPMRQFIIDSVCYWAEEYKIDGFRFDLMGLHDIQTINEISRKVRQINPDALLYGEPWMAGATPLKREFAAVKENIDKLDSVAIFCDNARNAIKGGVFADQKYERGFCMGATALAEQIKCTLAGFTAHPELCGASFVMPSPLCSVTYASCHDNLSLADKINVTCPSFSLKQKKAANALAAALVFLSQGIPFMQAGEEFIRSRPTNERSSDVFDGYQSNAYRSNDEVNAIKWKNKTKHQDLFKVYKSLIAFRREHSEFRLTTTQDVAQNLSFPPGKDGVVYLKTKKLSLFFNANLKSAKIPAPDGELVFGTAKKTKKGVRLAPLSVAIFEK